MKEGSAYVRGAAPTLCDDPRWRSTLLVSPFCMIRMPLVLAARRAAAAEHGIRRRLRRGVITGAICARFPRDRSHSAPRHCGRRAPPAEGSAARGAQLRHGDGCIVRTRRHVDLLDSANPSCEERARTHSGRVSARTPTASSACVHAPVCCMAKLAGHPWDAYALLGCGCATHLWTAVADTLHPRSARAGERGVVAMRSSRTTRARAPRLVD
jgi:hypothetical protein